MKVSQFAKIRKDAQGFTLIELMIVVAIIGILAAIAIPQFAAYRIRGYNASAQSDVRNLNTAESALFADWQRYGQTNSIAAAAYTAAAGAVAESDCIGGDPNGDGITTMDSSGALRGIQIGVGNGNTVVADTDVVAAAAVAPAAFIAAGKHVQGDTTFGMDSDSTAVYQNPTLVVVGTALTNAAFTASIATNAPAVNDFAAVATWIVK